MEKICSIQDCERPRRRHGYCVMHAGRYERHGDPLVLKRTENGEPLRFIREVAVPYAGNDCLRWPYAKMTKGYGVLEMDGQRWNASRLVCTLVHGAPPTHEHVAAHSCGKGHLGCVNPRHLGWKTPVENEADKVQHGTLRIGARNPQSKLTEQDVREIRLLVPTMRQCDIARKFGVTEKAIEALRRGRTWTWVI